MSLVPSRQQFEVITRYITVITLDQVLSKHIPCVWESVELLVVVAKHNSQGIIFDPDDLVVDSTKIMQHS